MVSLQRRTIGVPSPAKWRKRGFSLVELAIAISVLAIGILGVFASFVYGLQSTNHSARLSEAVNYSRQLVELIRVRNLPFLYATLPPPPTTGLNDTDKNSWEELSALEAPPFAHDIPPHTGFRRRIVVSRVPGSGGADYRSNLAEIRVSVQWMEKDQVREVEMVGHHKRP